MNFQVRYQEVARPFSWKFTRKDLKERLNLVSENVINQYQPVIFQESILEESPLWNDPQKVLSVYVNT
ncbi:MAG: hypothetical protein AUJ54_15985 [Ignavibacteria bacterium CG1_02_37_35]|nr:MAG: hypothetical protein AUJ54_15985 [Ignavibacteria bacterium CG1_02_37_35]